MYKSRTSYGNRYSRVGTRPMRRALTNTGYRRYHRKERAAGPWGDRKRTMKRGRYFKAARDYSRR